MSRGIVMNKIYCICTFSLCVCVWGGDAGSYDAEGSFKSCVGD